MTAVSPLQDNDPSGARLGAHVRALRRARGLTLVQLASATGLSHPFLSQVERGLANFSLPSLRRIAVALETSPVELIAAAEAADGAAPPPRVETYHAGDSAEPMSDFAQDPALPLAHGSRPFLPMTIECSRTEPGEAFTHAEDEWIMVLDGSLRLELDGVETLLGPGDSTYYSGGVLHRWWCAGDPVRLLAVKQQAGR